MSTQTHRPTERQVQTDERTLEDGLAAIGVQLAGYNDANPLVDRHHEPLFAQTKGSEPWETLRDALRRETRLRINPPGEWTYSSSRYRNRRSWTGYEHTVSLETTLLGPWTLEVDGDEVLESEDRMTAFRRAGEEMREIAMTEGR
ncbi:hypothetical protein [Halomontanus rarus]|uniref:hypothetical protein n=1 Tax=Halomontanus rarus TaxID=3034020 RepID=UPI00307C6BD5